ncbi:MAG: ABC transporter ATP-binding protein [Acidimicrobiia bacterium]
MNSAPAGADGTESAIEVIDVYKTFDRGVVKALDGLSLTIASGEFVAITGHSGCGKSTLLHLLAALDTPDSGSIHVDGNDLTHLRHPDRYRRQDIGIVFQLHNLLPQLSALQNVEIPMLDTQPSRHEQRERARTLLQATGLAGKEHRRPPELSGGERQRVAIARALANEPRVLLADEPTGNLDTEAVDQVLALLRQLRADRPITIVLVTHDPTVAAATDRVIHLRDGQVDETETVI